MEGERVGRETLTRASSEGWSRKKEHFSTSREQMARDTSPPTSRARPADERAVARQAQKARLAESGLPTHFFASRPLPPPFLPLSGLFQVPLRWLGNKPAAQDAHYRNCLALRFTGQRSFVTRDRHYRGRLTDGVFDVRRWVCQPRQRDDNISPIV